MRIITKALKQRACYWPPAAPDEEGQQTFGPVEEIRCRWEDVSEQFVAVSGETATSKAKVMVDKDLELLGVLRQGTVADLTNLTNPFANTRAWEIRRFDKVPTLKGTKFYRAAYL